MSMELKLMYLNRRIFKITFESNPLRKGWELHTIERQNFKLKDNPNLYDKYYLIDCYYDTLTEDEYNMLYSYADGLIQDSFFNYLNGRTSLSTQLNTTMEHWENIFNKHIEMVKVIKKKRQEFIRNN